MLPYIAAPWILWASSLDGLFHGKSEHDGWMRTGGIPAESLVQEASIYIIYTVYIYTPSGYD